MERMKNIIVALIIGLSLIVSTVVLAGAKRESQKAFELYGFEGVLYRINAVNGRVDLLVPSADGPVLFPVYQANIPKADPKMTAEQKKNIEQGWAQNLKSLSQYIQIERAKTLGLLDKLPALEGAKDNSKK